MQDYYTAKAYLTEHLESDCHKEAMRVTSSRRLAERRGGIAEAFDEVVTQQKKAFICSLRELNVVNGGNQV